jgi:hypothetical protein
MPTVSLLHGVQDRPIAERPAGHEEVLQSSGRHVVLGMAHEPAETDLAVVGLNVEEPVAEVVPEAVADPPAPRRRGRQVVHAPAVVGQRECDAGMRQRRADERLGCV